MSATCPESDWQLLLRLLPYAQRNWGKFLLSVVLLIPLAVAVAIQPILVQQGIDGPIANRDLVGLGWICLLVFLTIAVRLALQSWQGYLVQAVGQRITADIRYDLFEHVTQLSNSFFDRTPVGKLITRLTSDVEALGEVFATGAVGIFSDVVSIGITAVFMFFLRWELSLLLVFLIVPTTGLIVYFQYEFRKANYKAREHLSELNGILQENIIGINIVQLFQRLQLNSEQHRQVNQKYINAVNDTIFHDSAVSATLEWIALVAIGGVLWLGGQEITEQRLTFGELSAFVLYAQRLFEPLRQLAEKFTIIQSGFTAIARIADILNQPVEITDPPVPKSLSTIAEKGEIRFEGVWFAYKHDEYVLRDINFTVGSGEKVALVGPTGSGKSSIIRLLCRLYEPQRGRIFVNGVDIREVSQAELHRHIGVILQDAFLFSGNIYDNIALGEDYAPSHIETVAKAVNIHDLIMELPEGYHSQVRARGTNLSGGQKQLLAFARVAIRQPEILILDEATASLDVRTEAMIQQALAKLWAGKTAMIIAHRLSTIRHVDRILVLKHGEIVESGSHGELLSRGGLYAHLHALEYSQQQVGLLSGKWM
ncbi:MAG: ABC transporter ATP-binding protein [Pseudanabaenaceae cyanobacterium]